MKHPLVTVVIPNWNGAVHLPTCLESLRRQTFRDFEVIVVDNGSSDESLALLARDYPEVQVLALGENRGFAGACNAGIRAARGEFIVLLNNDTEADPHWLEEVVAAFGRHPEAGLVASKMRLFDRRDVLHTAGDYYRVDGRPGNRGVWRPTGASTTGRSTSSAPAGGARRTGGRCWMKSACWMRTFSTPARTWTWRGARNWRGGGASTRRAPSSTTN